MENAPAGSSPRISEAEFVRRLGQLIEAGAIEDGVSYSAEEIAGLLECSSAMVKRFMPVVAAARAIPATLNWTVRTVGAGTRYALSVTRPKIT